MTTAATSVVKHRSPEQAALLASKQALEKSGLSQADHVLFFASAKYRRSYPEILKIIRETTGAQNVVGASGFGILNEEIELERQPGISVLAFSSKDIAAEPFLIRHLQESSAAAGEKLGRQLRESLQAKLLLLFPDPFSFQNHSFFEGLESTCGYLPIIGGAAAEDGRETKTYQMHQEEVTYDAVCGMALGGNFRFETGITRSCRPFGEPLRITRAEGNTIYEMDGRPAYDILLESISHINFRDPDKIFQDIFIGIPLKNFQTDFSEDHYLVRNIMNVNAKKGMLTCTSPVEEGEFITFTFRNPDLARHDMRLMLEDLKARLGTSKPLMGFYFNCCARGEVLYGRSGQDVALIREYFPQMPVTGFFTYGELAPVDHVNHLHFHSGVLTVLAENS